MYPYNILEDDISEIDKKIKGDYKVAVICSADTKIEYCFTHKEEAYEKNVTASIRLFEKLKELNYKIIFLSTDNVFDGIKGNYKETDQPKASNEYGKMKILAENYLLEHIMSSCILRISKVVGDFSNHRDIFTDWYLKAKEGEKINCIKHNILTPTYVQDIVECFFIIVQQNLSGIYHIASSEVFERKELCNQFLHSIGLNGKVQEIDLEEMHLCDGWPLNVTLNNSKFIQKTGYSFTTMKQIFEAFCIFKKSLNNKYSL